MFNTLLKFTFLQYNLVLYFSWSISIIYLKSGKWLRMVCSTGLNLRYDLLQELFSYISIFINSKTLCIPCQTLNSTIAGTRGKKNRAGVGAIDGNLDWDAEASPRKTSALHMDAIGSMIVGINVVIFVLDVVRIVLGKP